jgi:hypothetical protein
MTQPTAAPKFLPFVGEQYTGGYQGQLKLLLLGESHYFPAKDRDKVHDVIFATQYTRSFIADCCEPLDGMPHCKNDYSGRLNRLVANQIAPTLKQIEAGWESVAYCNFIPHFVGEGASAKKRAIDWDCGEEWLPNELNKLEPDRILVLGKSVWNRLNCGGNRRDEKWKSGGRMRGLWAIPKSSGGDTIATWVFHPSRGRDSVEVMQEVLRDLLAYRE